ncbi:MAG: LacI family DNA-binding transcriptional regulator [Ktedonobacteraceae bacterium]|nr:LacI family DNA-binding transcriptional regulator [Ktedonobacteraceae bacterium]
MITIRDVASRAEVSIATVSRVVNGNRPVHPAIRERVLKAVEELNYRPNYLARGLRQRSTSMIGLITPDNSNPFYAEMARAVEDAGFAVGYSVILCNTDLSTEKQQAYLDVLLSHKVDGVILINIEDAVPQGTEHLLAEHIPIIYTNADTHLPDVDQVIVDNHQGGYLAGKYLTGLNHRRIGCVTLDSPRFYDNQRVAGFRQALAEAGIEMTKDLFTLGNGRYDSGYKAAQELIQRHPDLTAIFVFNDLMALGVMNALRVQGIQVPGDVSIIGFDDIFYASTIEPGLTTIAQPITAIGQESIAQLLTRIQQPEKPPTHILLPVELVERASCRRL